MFERRRISRARYRKPALTLPVAVVRADACGSLALAFGTEPGPARRMLHRTIELGEAGDVLVRRDIHAVYASIDSAQKQLALCYPDEARRSAAGVPTGLPR